MTSLSGAMSARLRAPTLRSGVVFSTAIHLAVLGAVVLWSMRSVPVRPPVYRVNLLGAPAGPRQAGIVRPTTSPPTAAPAPPINGAERASLEKALPTAKRATTTASAKATPSIAKPNSAGAKAASPRTKASPIPTAGAGAVGGKGADVVNAVRTNGIEFPFPGYLSNIQRQIALSWNPRHVSAALVAEVKFLIRRDGSVMSIEVVKSSRDRMYDTDAQAAIEAVGVVRGFRALPDGFKDDVLIVYFTFDYALRP